MEYEGDLIAVYNDQNLPLECEIISKFRNEETKKDYLVFTDGSTDENGEKNKFVVSYRADVPEEDKLRPVETEEEWESIRPFLEELNRALEEQKNGGSANKAE